MASTAKLAQFCALAIAGTPGSAITVTAATKANPMVVTATNTLAIGDVVVFGTSGLTGMPELSGRIGIVTAATGSNFTLNIDSSAFAAAATGGTCTPQTWTKISNLKDWDGFNAQVSEIDVSNLDSLAKEFVAGLEDFGTVSGTVDLDPTDAGQIAAMKAKSSSVSTYFRMTYPGASVYRAWKGFVKKFGEQGQVDGVIRSQFEVRCQGRVARSEVVN